MTWFCLSLGWRPISLTTVRQILFDKVYVRACASNPLGDIVLARSRLCWDAGRNDDSKVKWENMLSAATLLLRFSDGLKLHEQMIHTCVIYANSTYFFCFCYYYTELTELLFSVRIQTIFKKIYLEKFSWHWPPLLAPTLSVTFLLHLSLFPRGLKSLSLCFRVANALPWLMDASSLQ